MSGPQVFLAAALVVCAIGAAADLRSGHIPNTLTLGAALMAPLAHLAWGALSLGLRAGLEEAAYSLLGVVVCAALPLLLYALGAMFGGDVKLLGAVGALCQPRLGFEAVVYTFIAAAVLALARSAWDGTLRSVMRNTVNLAFNPFRRAEAKAPLSPEMMTVMRFGPAIFVGVLVTAIMHWREL